MSFTRQPDSAPNWEPEAADSRLAHTAGSDPAGVFTSDLSVSEYALLGVAGFEPPGFVIGSSIYHTGLQVARWGKNQELQVLTQCMYNARELARSRMQAEADYLSADGIVGVHLTMQRYVWGTDVLEFVATGTAVRALAGTGAHRTPAGRAFTSDLSAQPFLRHRRRERRRAQPCLGRARHGFLATGTAIRRLPDEHRTAATAPKPTFTLGLDR